MRFAPFNIGYPKLREHALAAGLVIENKWELVFDFSKTAPASGEDQADAASATKNFSHVPPEEF